MKKIVVIGILLILVLVFAFGYWKISIVGYASQGGPEFTGPTQAQVSCMETCSGCTYGDATCMQQHSARCGAECNVETIGAPEPADEGEACMQKCILVGCEEYGFDCQNSKRDACENECGMKGDAPDESEISEEQKCISDCVATVDPTIRCGAGSYEGEGETGGALCQRCADECVHLYSGPCLTDELWREKEDECMALGEHMEAAPIKGDSGEGYECTVDLDCIDRSNEWGDEPGTGPGIGQEGYIAPNVVAGAVDGIIKFFKGLFGGGGETKSGGEEPALVESEGIVG